jgi:beta-glucanase (GH16 family)
MTALAITACGGGGGTGNNTAADTTNPVINLNGATAVNHEQGTAYTDTLVTAVDNTDGAIAVTTSGAVGTEPGTYTLTYTARDAAGNPATATRTVTVTAPAVCIASTDDSTDPSLTIPSYYGYTSAQTYSGYSLVWSDEFSGTSLDQDSWTFETGNSGWGNNELQYYRPENTCVREGLLIIEAKEESFGGAAYTSSRIKTQDKQSFRYGRIDIRAVTPEGQGLWPALWMLGQSFSTVGWPNSGEIDIMEMIGGSGRENTTHGTIHWSDNGSHTYYGGELTLADGETLASVFHVFTIIWDSNSITWYIDDIQVHFMDITPASMAAFREEFFFIFNVAVGGNWPGSPNATTVFPQRMLVDYVRVFQKD